MSCTEKKGVSLIQTKGTAPGLNCVSCVLHAALPSCPVIHPIWLKSCPSRWAAGGKPPPTTGATSSCSAGRTAWWCFYVFIFYVLCLLCDERTSPYDDVFVRPRGASTVWSNFLLKSVWTQTPRRPMADRTETLPGLQQVKEQKRKTKSFPSCIEHVTPLLASLQRRTLHFRKNFQIWAITFKARSGFFT